jgi:hypothetical protein
LKICNNDEVQLAEKGEHLRSSFDLSDKTGTMLTPQKSRAIPAIEVCGINVVGM